MEKIGMSRKHLYNVSILMKIQYLACHMLRIMGSSLERQKQTKLCITYILTPLQNFTRTKQFCFFTMKSPFESSERAFLPLDDLIFMPLGVLCRYSGWEENATHVL